MTSAISRQAALLVNLNRPFLEFQQTWARLSGKSDLCDFAFGNPHDMPLPDFTRALQRHAEPQNKDWFAYKLSEPESTEVVAATLRERTGMPFEPADIAMTNGAFAAIALAIQTVIDPGDEVIFNLPPWFFYETMIVGAKATPVKVSVKPGTFDLDLDAIRAAITPRTRAILINSPHNPTGRIYPPDQLTELASILTEASKRNRREIYLFSDEAYNRIVYDERDFPSPVSFYPYSFLIYTYGKTLLTPGQRIGYLALPPTMPDREPMRLALMMSQVAMGWAFPNALLQHALPDLEKLSIDMEQLHWRRDRMVNALSDMGYQVHSPEGTFYLLPKSPWEDDEAFCALLAEHDVLCLPGAVSEIPGYFRISLTANDAMIERSLPRFQAAFQHTRTHVAPTRAAQSGD